jgi:hypothetical protein
MKKPGAMARLASWWVAAEVAAENQGETLT